MPLKNSKSLGKYKGIKNKRQGEIYDYFRRQLWQEKNADYLVNKPKREQDYFTSVLYKTSKLAKEERNLLLKQTASAYREEIQERNSQILFWQEGAGFTKPSSRKIIKKQKLKGIFYEKGEYKSGREKTKQVKNLWLQEVLTKKGSIEDKAEIERISKSLYLTSPRRLRDRFLIPTNQPSTGTDLGEIWNKYYVKNPFAHTKKYYLRAIQRLVNRTEPEGQPVPDSEIEFDKYGKPRLKAGQWIVFTGRPGRSWSVYKNVPSLEERIVQRMHKPAHAEYIEEHGSKMEKQTWKLKKDKALCWVEATLGQSCVVNQGTSSWWCLFCISFGSYHPPTLPKHCPWLYTYKTWLCGQTRHSDATKQWHFSVQGEKIRDKIKGGDWGSCHIGTFSKPPKKKHRGWKKPLI